MTESPSRLADALASHYMIERELGAGGMATVYLARDLRHDRPVAVKVLRPELAAVLGAERFLREIQIIAKLDHPHILTLIDSGESDGFVWYVLPYIRGESLRDRLTREKQLGVDEAVGITRQVAGALEYAHRQGVIHRDIKPENILIHEGEAMLADFGIALAVREAGGNRLTDTGISLGTPQYMSPEQATGDRHLDARSDVYSLGAVLYEMLTGNPPHVGATAQVVIAKLLTERPTRVRSLRDTVPGGIDNAVAKALAKVPADRFHTAGEFAAALTTPGGAPGPSRGRRGLVIVTGLAGTLMVATLVRLAVRSPANPAGPALAVRDRTQLTFTGNAATPAISADGKQLAYVERHCDAATCAYGIQIQDVGGGESRRLVDGATAVYSIRWSPDRRFLVFTGTMALRYGDYVVSTLYGAPRYLGPVLATFFPGGDSLLEVPHYSGAHSIWAWIATLDGEHRDSVWIENVFFPWVVPTANGRWLVVLSSKLGSSDLRLVDRTAHVRDRVPLSGGPDWSRPSVTSHALWVQLRRTGLPLWTTLRVPIDESTGRFAGRPDTVLVTSRGDFDVTGDGGAVVYGEGTDRYDVWAVQSAAAFRGQFNERQRLLSSTSDAGGVISPDGGSVVVVHRAGGFSGQRDILDVVPFAGGTKVTYNPSGASLLERLPVWTSDGTSFCYAEVADSGVRFVTVDASTGVRKATFAIGDSTVQAFDWLAGGGWVWIPPSLRGLRLQLPGEPRPRDLRMPDGDQAVAAVAAARDGARLVTIGWDSTGDSLRVHVTSLPDERTTLWATFRSQNLDRPRFLGDGSITIPVWETQESVVLYRLAGPGRVERLGTIPRPVEAIRVSADGRRLVLTTREFHGDIWLARVEPPGAKRN